MKRDKVFSVYFVIQSTWQSFKYILSTSKLNFNFSSELEPFFFLRLAFEFERNKRKKKRFFRKTNEKFRFIFSYWFECFTDRRQHSLADEVSIEYQMNIGIASLCERTSTLSALCFASSFVFAPCTYSSNVLATNRSLRS